MPQRAHETQPVRPQTSFKVGGERAELVRSRAFGGGDLGVLRPVLRLAAINERRRERRFGREVMEHARLAQTDLIGKVLKADGVEAALLNQPLGGVEKFTPHKLL